MDELPQELALALEETSPLVELDNDCQTSTFNSPKLARRQSRKRRGRKRRADPNPVWENAIKFSGESDTSLDEALKDYMENVAASQQYHSDTASEDAMMVKRLSSLNVTSSSNLYGESDSVTESHTMLRPQAHIKRKKRCKRMSVDAESSVIPEFMQEERQKRPKLKRSKKKRMEDDDIENSLTVKGKFGYDIQSLRRKGKLNKPASSPLGKCKDSTSPQSPGSGSSRRSSPLSPNMVTEERVMEDLSKKGACCSHEIASRVHSSDSSYHDDGRKQSGSDGASETTIGAGRVMECMSNESDVTMEATTREGK